MINSFETQFSGVFEVLGDILATYFGGSGTGAGAVVVPEVLRGLCH